MRRPQNQRREHSLTTIYMRFRISFMSNYVSTTSRHYRSKNSNTRCILASRSGSPVSLIDCPFLDVPLHSEPSRHTTTIAVIFSSRDRSTRIYFEDSQSYHAKNMRNLLAKFRLRVQKLDSDPLDTVLTGFHLGIILSIRTYTQWFDLLIIPFVSLHSGRLFTSLQSESP
jgi:hypothetical protein